MGFNVTALAQKARTQTLIVDSNLDMGQYDVIATDVKGDTAEFSEFVGGVGNFESGLISGGLDVGDILHAESSMQIDGDLVVEGAINNVNITNEGAISTAKSVTATGGFVGKLTGNVTGSISGGTVAGSTGTFSGNVSTPSLLSPTATNKFKLYISETSPALAVLYRYGSTNDGAGIRLFTVYLYGSSNTSYTFTSKLGLEGGGAWYNIVSVSGDGYGSIRLEPDFGCNVTIKTPTNTYQFTNETARTMSINELNDIFGNICTVTITRVGGSSGQTGGMQLTTTKNSYAHIMYA